MLLCTDSRVHHGFSSACAHAALLLLSCLFRSSAPPPLSCSLRCVCAHCSVPLLCSATRQIGLDACRGVTQASALESSRARTRTRTGPSQRASGVHQADRIPNSITAGSGAVDSHPRRHRHCGAGSHGTEQRLGAQRRTRSHSAGEHTTGQRGKNSTTERTQDH